MKLAYLQATIWSKPEREIRATCTVFTVQEIRAEDSTETKSLFLQTLNTNPLYIQTM